jgi:hypothetical protein
MIGTLQFHSYPRQVLSGTNALLHSLFRNSLINIVFFAIS